MLQELKFQLSTAILTVLTIAAAIAAALNYQQIHRFRLPDDGVVWADATLQYRRNSLFVIVHRRDRSSSGTQTPRTLIDEPSPTPAFCDELGHGGRRQGAGLDVS